MATQARTPITLRQIHDVVGGELVGSPQATVTSLASFEEAGPNDLTFVTGDRMLKTGGPTAAGILLAHRRLAEITNPHIVVANPTLAFAQVARVFFCPVPPPRGIDATVVRGNAIQIGPDVSIWPGVTLGDRVTIGARVILYPGVFIGNDTTIGDDTLLYPNVVVREGCTIGARVIVHSGTVIGSDGFGYVQDQGRHYKIPQLGGVTIEDDVELGQTSQSIEPRWAKQSSSRAPRSTIWSRSPITSRSVPIQSWSHRLESPAVLAWGTMS
jgi:UDP-3-O-[3-hydroxymyristoyl] glucosamine N-acyltransferase